MEFLKTKKVADLVTENIKTADVFKKYGIDFCCQGGISIQKAADKANIDCAQLEEELLKVENTTSPAYDYNHWEIDFLTDHVINVHHKYVEGAIPVLIQYAEKVHKVHGHEHPELLGIKELFNGVAGDFAAHCKKEELILFPFIKRMIKAEKEGAPMPASHFKSVDDPIKMMEVEHEEAGEVFRKIATLSNHYTPPEGACNTYRAFYAKLDEFEQDLHQHVHLENNILFPKSLKLEENLRAEA